MWKQVDDAINQGLPKSAIEKLDAILAQTLKDKAYPEAALALARKIRIETEIQGNQPQEGINRLKKEMESVPAEMKPIL